MVAFGKLRGSLSGKPMLLPGRHLFNLAMLGASIWLGAQFVEQGHDQALISLLIVMGDFIRPWGTLDRGNRWGGYARSGFHAE